MKGNKNEMKCIKDWLGCIIELSFTPCVCGACSPCALSHFLQISYAKFAYKNWLPLFCPKYMKISAENEFKSGLILLVLLNHLSSGLLFVFALIMLTIKHINGKRTKSFISWIGCGHKCTFFKQIYLSWNK